VAGRAPQRTIRGWRRWLFAPIPAIVFLLVLEGGAWIGDALTGYRARLLRGLDAVETQMLPVQPTSDLPWPAPALHVRCTERDGAHAKPWRIGSVAIPDSISEFLDAPTSPEKVRAAGDRSVFIVGGSAAFGHPYPYRHAFPTRLGARLRKRGHVVLNAAQSGWSSARVTDVVKRVADHYNPDVVIVMCGNNEWIHWTPPHQPWGDRMDVEGMRAWSTSRAVALLLYWSVRRGIARMDDVRAARLEFAEHRELTGVAFALEHPMERYLDFDAQAWLQTKEHFLDVFEDNLVTMVRAAREAGARVILMTIPFKHRLSPAWKHPQPESFIPEHTAAVRAAVAQAGAEYRSGRNVACLATTAAALVLDPHPPILHALRGEALMQLGRNAEAETAFAQCREQMVGNLGARLSINDRIRSVTASWNTDLVDAARLFDARQHALGGWFNRDLIHDDSHPTPEGHRVLADALAQRLSSE